MNFALCCLVTSHHTYWVRKKWPACATCHLCSCRRLLWVPREQMSWLVKRFITMAGYFCSACWLIKASLQPATFLFVIFPSCLWMNVMWKLLQGSSADFCRLCSSLLYAFDSTHSKWFLFGPFPPSPTVQKLIEQNQPQITLQMVPIFCSRASAGVYYSPYHASSSDRSGDSV